MKNLAHIPLEELELSPSHTGIKWFRRGGYGHLSKVDRQEGRYSSGAYGELCLRLQRIVKASIGRNWDDVYSRLREEVIGIKFEFDFNYWAYNEVVKPAWSHQFQRWEVARCGRRWHGNTTPLTEYIQDVKQGKYRFVDEFYYICPKSNMLRLVRARRPKQKKDPDRFRIRYKFLSDKRREWKERRKPNEVVLTLINDPELYNLYIALSGEYKSLLKKVEEFPKIAASLDKSKFWDRMKRRSGSYIPTQKDLARMKVVEEQIKELETGNFDVFFESALYLYARQKECHHVKIP